MSSFFSSHPTPSNYLNNVQHAKPFGTPQRHTVGANVIELSSPFQQQQQQQQQRHQYNNSHQQQQPRSITDTKSDNYITMTPPHPSSTQRRQTTPTHSHKPTPIRPTKLNFEDSSPSKQQQPLSNHHEQKLARGNTNEERTSNYFSETSLNLISKAYEMKKYVESELSLSNNSNNIHDSSSKPSQNHRRTPIKNNGHRGNDRKYGYESDDYSSDDDDDNGSDSDSDDSDDLRGRNRRTPNRMQQTSKRTINTPNTSHTSNMTPNRNQRMTSHANNNNHNTMTPNSTAIKMINNNDLSLVTLASSKKQNSSNNNGSDNHNSSNHSNHSREKSYLERTRQNIEGFELMKSEILDLKNQVSQLTFQVQQEREKRRRDRTNFDVLREQQDKHIQMKSQQLDQLKTVVKELEEANKRKDEESLTHMQDKSNLRTKINVLEKTIAEKEEKIRSNDRSHLKPLLDEYQKQIEKMIKNHEMDMERARKEKEDLEKAVEDGRVKSEELIQLNQRYQSLERDFQLYRSRTDDIIREYESKISKYDASVQKMIEEKRSLNDSFNNSMNEVYQQIMEREKAKNEAMTMLENVNNELRADLAMVQEQFKHRLQEKDGEINRLIAKINKIRDEDFATQSVMQINKEIKFCLGEVKSLIHLIQSRLTDIDLVLDDGHNRSFSSTGSQESSIQHKNSHSAALHNVLLLRKEMENLKNIVMEQYSLHISSAVNDCATQ